MSRLILSSRKIEDHAAPVRVSRLSRKPKLGRDTDTFMETVSWDTKVRAPSSTHDRYEQHMPALHIGGPHDERVQIEFGPHEALNTAAELTAAALWALEER